MLDAWLLEDGFGRRWRLWLAPPGAPGGLPRESARRELEALVRSCLGSHDDQNAASALLSIHERLTGLSLAGRSFQRADGATARRRVETVSDVLGRAASLARLRIERAAASYGSAIGGPARVERAGSDGASARRLRNVVDEAPDTIRDASSPEAVLDWIGVVVRDEDGAPLSNVRCRITAPGRAPTAMRTDASGRLLLRGIESGSCAIELPEVDGREWSGGRAAAG